MKRKLLVLGIIIFVFLTFCISKAAKRNISKKIPITIEAKKMFVDNKRKFIEFTGSVVAIRGDMKVSCNRMEIFLDKSGDVKIIKAEGNVKVKVGDKIVTSEKAVYFSDEDKIVFTGAPKAWLGENVVSGDRIIYFIKDDRSIVESEGQNKKVNAVIVPEEAKENATSKTLK